MLAGIVIAHQNYGTETKLSNTTPTGLWV